MKSKNYNFISPLHSGVQRQRQQYISRSRVKKRTEQKFNDAVNQKVNSLIKTPPAIDITKLLPRIISNQNCKAVVCTTSNKRRKKIENKCKNVGLSTAYLSTDYSKCKSYNGYCGKDIKNKAHNKVNKYDVSLGQLHATDLPCQPGCPFNRLSKNHSKDVLIVHPAHLYSESVTDNRLIFTDALDGDNFITKIESPEKAFGTYIDETTAYTGYSDFIAQRDKNSPSTIEWIHASDPDPHENQYNQPRLTGPLKWNTKFDPTKLDKKFGMDIDKTAHPSAPLVLFGLSQQNIIKLDNGLETTFWRVRYRNDTAPRTGRIGVGDLYNLLGVDIKRFRLVRKPGNKPRDDTIYVLRVPDFSNCKKMVVSQSPLEFSSN